MSKTLSYGNWSVVMKYLDLNVRAFLAARAPSLQNIHQELPIKVVRLQLNPSSFVLNNIEHSFYTFMENTTGAELPLDMQLINLQGGQPFDLDNCGRQEPLGARLSGDLGLASYVRYYRTPYPSTNPHYQYNSMRFPSGHKIRYIIREHLQTMFTGPSIPIVKTLEIGMDNCVLRLPEGFKIQIRALQLECTARSGLERLLPIIDESSFPLKKLTFGNTWSQDFVFQNEIVKTAESLDIAFFTIEGLVPSLLQMKNKIIHLSKYCISVIGFRKLAAGWVAVQKPLGTRLSMAAQFQFVRRLIENLEKKRKKQSENATKGDLYERRSPIEFLHCYTLAMDRTKELNFYIQKSPNYNREIEKKNGLPWDIYMEVMKKGAAIPL